MKIKKLSSMVFKTKKRKIAFAVISVVIILIIVGIATYNYRPKADVTALNSLLVESSDLTTAKLNITNMIEYEDEGIKILNRSDFIMVCNATVWAGVDMEEVKIVSDDAAKIIYISIPKATIQNVKIDSSTIKYFDEKFSLFNVNEKEDTNKAVVIAEKKVKDEALKSGILELADKQSATLIEGLLSKAIPKGYKIDAKVVN